LKKRSFLLFIGLNLILIGICCINLVDFLPTNPFSDNQKDISTEIVGDFTFIEGVDCIPDISSYEVGTLVDVIDGDSIRVIL